MATIYLVRHGKTLWNREKRLQGNMNSPLAPEGKEQAEALGRSLKGTRWDAVYSSPLGRTRETLNLIVGEDYETAEFTDALREVNLGPLEGLTKSEIPGDIKDQFDMFWSAPEKFNLEGAERIEEMYNRVIPFIESLKNIEGNVLLVTHTVVIKLIFCWLQNLPLSDLWSEPYIPPTSLTVFNWNGETTKIVKAASLDHLEVKDFSAYP